MKKLFSTLTLLVLGITAMVAQVTFSVSYKRVSPTELDIVFTGKIPAGSARLFHSRGRKAAPRRPLSRSTNSKVPNSKAHWWKDRAKRLNTTKCLT